MRNVYKILVRIPEGKTPHERLRRSWDETTETGLRTIECGAVDWLDLAQDGLREAGSCKHSNELSGYIKGGKFIG
jgi:hypothetical protein